MCAKYKLRLNDDKFIKIPLSLDFNGVGQSEIVESEFESVEVEKSINEIVDYEKVRFTPMIKGEVLIDVNNLIFKVNLLDENGALFDNTTYGKIGFLDDDIKFQKSRFLNTFLTLNFYDSDITTNQNLLSQITIFSKVTEHEIIPLVDEVTGEPNIGGGLPINANEFPVRYILNDPISNPKGFAEGYYVYHFKSDELPKELYVRGKFNNASTGISTTLTSTSQLDLPLNELIDKLHVRYLLERTNDGFIYSIDPDYNSNTNVTESGGDITVNLYEIKAK